jgi:hypothetical protein
MQGHDDAETPVRSPQLETKAASEPEWKQLDLLEPTE